MLVSRTSHLMRSSLIYPRIAKLSTSTRCNDWLHDKPAVLHNPIENPNKVSINYIKLN